MHHLQHRPAPVLSHKSPRRAALRALGVAGALAGALGLGAVSTSAKRSTAEKKKKRKQGPPGPAGPVGPPGPQGPVGPSGITSTPAFGAFQSVKSTVGQSTSAEAQCPSGSVATGGGYSLAGVVTSFGTVNVIFSGKSGNGWAVTVNRVSPPMQMNDLTLQASVVCTSTT
jgi:hypothetical protein